MDLHLLGLFGGTASGFLLGAGLAFRLGRHVGEQRGFEAAKFAQSYGAFQEGTAPGVPGWQQMYAQQLPNLQPSVYPTTWTTLGASAMPITTAPATNTYTAAPYAYGYAPNIYTQALGGGGGGSCSISGLDYSALMAQAKTTTP